MFDKIEFYQVSKVIVFQSFKTDTNENLYKFFNFESLLHYEMLVSAHKIVIVRNFICFQSL